MAHGPLVLFSQKQRIWHFMEVIFIKDNLHKISNRVLLEKYYNLSSAEILPIMLSVKIVISSVKN